MTDRAREDIALLVETLEKAIASANFKVENDARGRPTLWCKECGRDSGFHWSNCSKTRANRIQRPDQE